MEPASERDIRSDYYIEYNKKRSAVMPRHNHAFCFPSSFILLLTFAGKDKTSFFEFRIRNIEEMI